MAIEKRNKVAVAMSGGVDSSLSASLLLEQGYDVVGVTLLLCDSGRDTAVTDGVPQYIADARAVAARLGIEHIAVDLRDVFRSTIMEYFSSEYIKGRTPNPCVMCNEKIKFAEIMKAAAKCGADSIATGHYARACFDDRFNRYVVKKGKDERKDQSYVLYRLPQTVLERAIFPLGDFSKDEVRRMAKERGLAVADKPESQEICFVPKDDYKSFLKVNAPESCKAGDVVDSSGNVLGRHGGVAFHTVGQRRGLGIAAPYPLYVTSLDAEENKVIVGSSSEVYSKSLIAEDAKWIAFAGVDEPFEAMAKIRYGNREQVAKVCPDGEKILVEFAEPVRAVAPGQSIVFYDGDTLLGGGIIARSK